ncbi:DegV family protein [Paenisporosarcina cavernae]|uniref:DegV family protein n=1 Tax=Paenisporosarcina cavernae TaxID=2320858 RepID=A0A385YYY6_9BACL|nr:DegV family protein [Paenisporosarcina cavernae]AYC30783.1 DegV family protein [Paenisporosarcina cavernae]
MKTIRIVTDSTAELRKKQIEELQIEVVPLSIQLDGKTYTDKVDLDSENFLTLMEQSSELPKSSQPAVGVFQEMYDRIGSNGETIISIHMTGGMSGTVKSAQAAADMSSSNIHVVDSQFISYALSFQVIEAATMAKNGSTEKEILERLQQLQNNTHLFVVVDTLENLVKGGRIGKGKAMVGSLLNIKPIAALIDGVYTPVAKARSHKQVVQYLIKQFDQHITGKTLKHIGISHASGYNMMNPLLEKLKERGVTNIATDFTNPIISTHTGIGAIGFMYTVE